MQFEFGKIESRGYTRVLWWMQAICGDGLLVVGEECDDGNQVRFFVSCNFVLISCYSRAPVISCLGEW